MDDIQKIVAYWTSAYATSKALFEDYTEVVAKLENKSPVEVRDRVNKRKEEIITEVKSSLRRNDD